MSYKIVGKIECVGREVKGKFEKTGDYGGVIEITCKGETHYISTKEFNKLIKTGKVKEL